MGDLELLVCGTPELDMKALREVTVYDGGLTMTLPLSVGSGRSSSRGAWRSRQSCCCSQLGLRVRLLGGCRSSVSRFNGTAALQTACQQPQLVSTRCCSPNTPTKRRCRGVWK